MQRHRLIFALGSFALASLSVLPTARAQGLQRVAGIEIGSKSVKATLLEIPAQPSDRALKPAFDPLVFQTNLTANLRDGEGGKWFNDDAVNRAAEQVGKARLAIKAQAKGDVPIFLVASSGVAGSVVPDSLKALEKAIKDQHPDLTLGVLAAKEEVRLTFLGIVEAARRETTLLFDIGSGNTKFGFARPGRAGEWRTVSDEIRLGSNTLVPEASKIAGGGPSATVREQMKQFEDQASKVKEDLIGKLAAKLTPDMIGGRDTIYLTGGIVWAMVSLERPEFEEKSLVPIDDGMLASFARRVRSDDPFLVKAGDDKAERQARAVRAVFTRQQLLAGAVILEAACKALNVPDSAEKRVAYFSRDALIAWIKGYVEERAQLPPRAETQKELLDLFRELNSGVEKISTELRKPPSAPPQDLSTIIKPIHELGGRMTKLEEELIAIRGLLEKGTRPSVARRDPEKAWYNFYRGLAHYRGGHFARAREHFAAAIGEAGDEPAFWYGLALTQFRLDDPNGLRVSAARLVDFKLAGDPFDKLQYNHLFMYIQGVDRQAVDGSIQASLDESRLAGKSYTSR